MPLINGLFKFVLLMTLLFSFKNTAIINRNRYFPDSYSSGFIKSNNIIPIRRERRLLDEEFKIDPVKYGLDRKLSAKRRKLKLLKIAKNIVDNANRKSLNIDKVVVGSNIKNMFHDKNIVKKLSRYLNDKHLDDKIGKLENKKRNKSLMKLTQEQKEQLTNLKDHINDTKLNTQISSHSIVSNLNPQNMNILPKSIPNLPRGLNEGLMKFSYHPGIGGPIGSLASLPINNGINFHPPSKININSIVDPMSHAKLSPLELNLNNLKEQTSDLNKTRSKLFDMNNILDNIGQKMEQSLDSNIAKLSQAAN